MENSFKLVKKLDDIKRNKVLIKHPASFEESSFPDGIVLWKTLT